MKRLVAFILAMGMLILLCACEKKTAETPTEASRQETSSAETTTEPITETEETTAPEKLTYAQEHDFQFVGASAPMDYQYASRMYCNGLTDVDFEPDVWNSSRFQLVSVAPLADDPNYIVYTIKGYHEAYCRLSGVQEADGVTSDFGTNVLDLCFVDANTGYRIPKKNVSYSGNDHQEYAQEISSAGKEAEENEISLDDILASQGFQWDGEEIHISLFYSGDSHVLKNDIHTESDGRCVVDFSGQLEDEFILVLPAGYTGLCIGCDISKTGNDPNHVKRNEEESDGLELFEPEEGERYFFRRLDEMASLLQTAVISGRTESAALAKSIASDGADLTKMPNIAATSDGTVLDYLGNPAVAHWSSLATVSEEARELLVDKGIYDITIAADTAESFYQPEAARTGICSVDAINRSTGLLVEIVAFDGQGNVVGRSGIIGPQEFISGFPLDEIPETVSQNIDGHMHEFNEDTGTWTVVDEPYAYSTSLGAYVYDLEGNFLFYEIFGTQLF